MAEEKLPNAIFILKPETIVKSIMVCNIIGGDVLAMIYKQDKKDEEWTLRGRFRIHYDDKVQNSADRKIPFEYKHKSWESLQESHIEGLEAMGTYSNLVIREINAGTKEAMEEVARLPGFNCHTRKMTRGEQGGV